MLYGDNLAPCSSCNCVGGRRSAEMGLAHLYDDNGRLFFRETCPRKEITPESTFLLQLHQQSRNFQCLPFPGSLTEQPARVWDAFAIIDRRMEFWQRKEAAKQKKSKSK